MVKRIDILVHPRRIAGVRQLYVGSEGYCFTHVKNLLDIDEGHVPKVEAQAVVRNYLFVSFKDIKCV